MGLANVMVASVVSFIVIVGTMQGIAVATKTQYSLAQKSQVIIEAQSINNILQDVTACNLSKGTQTILYNNGLVAYTIGGVNNPVASFAWSTQGSATVLTIQPNNTMYRPVVLNLNCNVVVASPTPTPTPVVTCAANTDSGSNNTISGCGNIVSGSNNNVSGNSNTVSGSNNKVPGSCNVVSGSNGTFSSNNCK